MGPVWCSHYKAGCFFSWERTAVDQRQLIGRECSQLFNLQQTLITDATGQHLMTSTPPFDVIVHSQCAHTHLAEKRQCVLFDTAGCQFIEAFWKSELCSNTTSESKQCLLFLTQQSQSLTGSSTLIRHHLIQPTSISCCAW